MTELELIRIEGGLANLNDADGRDEIIVDMRALAAELRRSWVVLGLVRQTRALMEGKSAEVLAEKDDRLEAGPTDHRPTDVWPVAGLRTEH